MDKPLVSAIVPVYNGERYLQAAIESILNQDYRPIELIVMDDGSTDNTAHIAKSFDESVYIHQENRGVGAARNAGIRAANGEFIAFLDSDDVWMPNKLSIQIDFLCNHPEVGYVLTNQRIVMEEGIEKPPWFCEELFNKDHVGFFPSTLMVRSGVFESVGLYDADYRYGEDIEWFARAKDKGIQKAIIPETLLIKRIHDENLTYHFDKCRSSVLKVLKTSIDRQRIRKDEGISENSNGKK